MRLEPWKKKWVIMWSIIKIIYVNIQHSRRHTNEIMRLREEIFVVNCNWGRIIWQKFTHFSKSPLGWYFITQKKCWKVHKRKTTQGFHKARKMLWQQQREICSSAHADVDAEIQNKSGKFRYQNFLLSSPALWVMSECV